MLLLHVVVRGVSPSISRCELTCVARQPIDLTRIEAQHAAYVAVFRQAASACTPTGETARNDDVVRITELPPLADHPDSMFVEDAAIVCDEFAILTRPGALSRRGEVDHIAATIHALRPGHCYRLTEPATADGGDVLVIGKHVFVGLSTRTNREGFSQIAEFARPYGYTCDAVHVVGCLHLKSAASKLDDRYVLIRPDLIDSGSLKRAGFICVELLAPSSPNVLSFVLHRGTSRERRFIVVPAEDPTCCAVVSAWANDLARTTPVAVLSLPVDEIAKAEGALTCSSLLAYVEQPDA